MNLKATVIVDNIGTEQLCGEWGLCIAITYGDRKLLLDGGASSLFVENAKQLGISLSEIDMAVLSHAHYDHANGMEAFFAENQKAKLYLQKSCAENCYHKTGWRSKYIGIPRHLLSNYADRMVRVDGDCRLADGIFLVPHKTAGLQENGKREKMYRREGLRRVWDDFSHEQSLVFDTPRGLVIFNGCCHGGAANVIRETAETFPDRNVYGLIGGFHTHNKSEAEVRALARQIRESNISYVCTGHCSGQSAYGILCEELGDRMHRLQVGLEMDFS